jgi:hypothetical protein
MHSVNGFAKLSRRPCLCRKGLFTNQSCLTNTGITKIHNEHMCSDKTMRFDVTVSNDTFTSACELKI